MLEIYKLIIFKLIILPLNFIRGFFILILEIIMIITIIVNVKFVMCAESERKK